ncbi:extended synaptotagmin-2 isoform X2 [Prorops nasuta]|uniref:extended synaptotagmin-2 isoform X2 n=1 Tax=Prorops nasuta TaxID=863751 RepID=UPI0034CFCB0D
MDINAEEDKNKLVPWPYMNITSLAKKFIVNFAAASFIWSIGYMNWSIAWLLAPIAFTAWNSEKHKDSMLKTITAQASVLTKEKDLITSRLDDLPSWVYFPDFDRAEWLNRILEKVWPSINHFIREVFKNTIEPSIVESLTQYKITGFRFGRLVLGRIPPKIYGIKAYDKNTSRDEIILDADILYAGDCDITFNIGNIKGGIRDFQIRGLMRIVMKPLIPVIPLIGGVQIFFLNSPSIHYNLVGVADVLDLPGFSEILRRIIVEQIAAKAVLPNKIVIPLSEDIPAEVLKIPEPEGVLRIHVVEAKHLMKKDIGVLGKGKSDPYAIINVGAQEFRTKTIVNTIDPKWDFWCECAVTSAVAQQLTVLIWDYDDTKGDESLGRATIEVNRVKRKGTIDTWVSLEQAKHGMVHLRLTWLQLSKNSADLPAALMETQQLRVTSMSTALLILYIDSAKNLPCVRGNKQPDVYLEASVSGQTQRTTTILRSCDPVWEKGFTFLVSNPETGVLHIKLTDEKTGLIVGEMHFNITTLMEKKNLEIARQPYDLQKADRESRIVMSLSLSILKYEQPEVTADDDEDDHDLLTNGINKIVERQESNISGEVSSTVSPSHVAFQKQSSKESIESSPRSVRDRDQAPIEMVTVEEEPLLTSSISSSVNASPHLLQRNPSVTSSAGESKLGRIQLTLRYSISRQKLIIFVHKIANLPVSQNDPRNLPDPYVKFYLLPDKHKETKRKTAVVKDNCNPVYDEQFEYVVSQGDLYSRILEVSVCTQKAWLSTGSNMIGQVHIKLCDIDMNKAATAWHDLNPELKD